MKRLARHAAAAVVVFTSAACSKRETPPTPQTPGAQILRISQRNEPSDLDPATASLPDDYFIIRALSEGLVNPAPTSVADRVLPGAAERWEVSADGLTYTFHLRPNAQWSNGEPVTAEDFVQSFRRVLDPTTAAPKASLFFAVKNARRFATGEVQSFDQVGFTAPNQSTVVVSLERPTPEFLLYAASGPWIPVNPRVVARHGRNWTRPGNFVGNGPFVLTEWVANQRIAVQKNPRFRDPSRVRLDTIQFLAFDSGDTEDRAYRAGQVDVTMAVPSTKLETHARERPAELHRAALAETRYLSFNTTRPPLNDVRVRRALSLVIDRKQIVERVLKGGHEPAGRFLAPALRGEAKAGANGTVAGVPDVDLALARRLLADAGYPGGTHFPRLEVSTWTVGSPVNEVLQQMWKSTLGIDVALVTREAKVHVAALREGRYDIAFIHAIPDVPDAANVLENFVTGAANNYPHWSDQKYDALMKEAAYATAGSERTELLAAAEARLLEEAPLAPLYFNARNWLMSPRVRGWQNDALWTRFYLDVHLAEN